MYLPELSKNGKLTVRFWEIFMARFKSAVYIALNIFALWLVLGHLVQKTYVPVAPLGSEVREIRLTISNESLNLGVKKILDLQAGEVRRGDLDPIDTAFIPSLYIVLDRYADDERVVLQIETKDMAPSNVMVTQISETARWAGIKNIEWEGE